MSTPRKISLIGIAVAVFFVTTSPEGLAAPRVKETDGGTAAFILQPVNPKTQPPSSYPEGTTIVGQEIRLGSVPTRVWFEVLVTGFPSESSPSCAAGVQARIDPAGFLGSLAGCAGSPGGADLASALQSCITNTDCRNSTSGLSGPCFAGEPSCCQARLEWMPPGGKVCDAAFQDRCDPEWISFDLSGVALVDMLTPNVLYGVVLDPDECFNDFAPSYVGTLVVDVPTSAFGRYTINFNQAETYMLDGAHLPIPTTVFRPGIITVGCLALPPLPDPTAIDKARFISFQAPPGQTGDTALQVTLVSLMHPDPPNLPQFPPPDFTLQEGTVRYVGVPGDCQETESPPTTFKCASLQCAPLYMDWNAALGGQTLHVTGQAVVPSSSYEVRQLAASCQGNESLCAAISAPLTINTARWGDVAAPFQAPSPAPLTQPNVIDIAAVVDKFRSVPSAIIVARADVNPAIPNSRVDIADVANIVDAFKNLAYPFPGPAACP